MRSFLAIDLPGEVKQQIDGILSSFRKESAGIKWVEKQNLHLTLRFFGALSPDEVEKVKIFLKSFAAGKNSFTFTFSGIGVFPPSGTPAVLWLGIDGGAELLKETAGVLRSGLETLGFAGETQPFHLHLTLGRLKSGQGNRHLIEKTKQISFGSLPEIHADKLIFFKSTLRSSGPVYEAMGEYPFTPALS